MKLLFNGIILVFNLYIRGLSRGEALKIFCTHMGIVYIKLAQMLAMQNIDGVFSEEDRQKLMSVCDDCNPIPFKEIKKTLKANYGKNYNKIIKRIDKKPVGSASVSQVHRAILSDGSKVVFKVKRKDIYDGAKKSIIQIRFVVHKFGWIIGLKNKTGSNKGLDQYIEWIEQELDFRHEVYNIKRYAEFAKSVNGKVPGCVNIVTPKVYDQYCTDDIIVMEYIPYSTIFNFDKDVMSNEHILNAFNSYIKLSFYALLHNLPVVFHGDPHGGNVYIDKDGNIGFLDMGLIFELTPCDAEAVKELFFCAYFAQTDKLYKVLVPYLNGTSADKENFRKDIKDYCENINRRPVTAYFMDMVLVCFKYNIAPPSYLFGMAKAFICLGGVDTIYNQSVIGRELLEEQVYEYIMHKSVSSIKQIGNEHIRLLTELLASDKTTVIRTIAKDADRVAAAIRLISSWKDSDKT